MMTDSKFPAGAIASSVVPQQLISPDSRDSEMNCEPDHIPGAQELLKCPYSTCSCELERQNFIPHCKESTHLHIFTASQQIEKQEEAVRQQKDEISRLVEQMDQLKQSQMSLNVIHQQAIMALSASTVFAPEQRSPLTVYDRDLYLVSQPELTRATYRWRIDNFSKVRRKELQSTDFNVGDLRWFLRVSAPDDNLQLYLRVPHTIVSYPRDWKAHVQMAFGVINQTNEKKSVWRYTTHTFDQNSVSWGYANFLSMDELYIKDADFVVNDSIIVEVTMKVFAEKSPRMFGPQASSGGGPSSHSHRSRAQSVPIHSSANVYPIDLAGAGFRAEDFSSMSMSMSMQDHGESPPRRRRANSQSLSSSSRSGKTVPRRGDRDEQCTIC